MLALAATLVVLLALGVQLQKSGAWLLQSWTGERVVLAFRAELFRRAQRLSMNRLNWCVGPGGNDYRTPMVQGPTSGYRQPMATRQR